MCRIPGHFSVLVKILEPSSERKVTPDSLNFQLSCVHLFVILGTYFVPSVPSGPI